MLDCKKITGFISYKFVKVNQAIEEDPNLLVVFLEFVEREVTFLSRLNHIIHLTEQVHEKNRFVIKILQSMNLLLIEIFHLMWCYNLVVVKIYDWKPVLETTGRSLVLLWKHEPYKIFIAHFVFLPWFEFARNLFKYTVYCLSRKCMSLISREIFFINEKIMISIKLPKATI